MEKTPKLFRRKIYIWGSKMINVSLISLVGFSLTCSVTGTSFYGIFLRDWKYFSFSFLELIWNSLIYALCIAVVAGLLIFIIKTLAIVLGLLLRAFGERDKIEFKKGPDGRILKLIIENKEDTSFSGEFKIMKINDEKLSMPLLMGIVHGDDINHQVNIPKDEPVEIGLGLFNEQDGMAYFLDAHNQGVTLNPQTRVYTKLSGNLKDGTEIIKENIWFINYKNNNGEKQLGFANLLEIKSLR